MGQSPIDPRILLHQRPVGLLAGVSGDAGGVGIGSQLLSSIRSPSEHVGEQISGGVGWSASGESGGTGGARTGDDNGALAQLHSSIKSAASGGSDLHRLIVGMADRLLLSLGLRCGRRGDRLLRDDDGLRRLELAGRGAGRFDVPVQRPRAQP